MQVTEETEALRFNTGIAAMMEFVNAATKWPAPRPVGALRDFVLLLSPCVPAPLPLELLHCRCQ